MEECLHVSNCLTLFCSGLILGITWKSLRCTPVCTPLLWMASLHSKMCFNAESVTPFSSPSFLKLFINSWISELRTLIALQPVSQYKDLWSFQWEWGNRVTTSLGKFMPMHFNISNAALSELDLEIQMLQQAQSLCLVAVQWRTQLKICLRDAVYIQGAISSCSLRSQ